MLRSEVLAERRISISHSYRLYPIYSIKKIARFIIIIARNIEIIARNICQLAHLLYICKKIKLNIMYTEILRIIEGGLSKDSQKVYNYAKILADKMSRDGETKMSKMILDSLERRYTSMLSLDELSSTPVDAESR